MKPARILILIFAFFILFCGDYLFAADEDFPKIGFVKNDGANVRAGDNVNFETLCKLRKGDPVTITDRRYSWFKILLPTNAYVYINSDYVDPDYVKAETGVVNAQRVNLRAGPDTKYSIVGQVSEPESVKIISEENGWYKIEPPAQTTGWLHSDLVTFDLGSLGLPEVKREGIGIVKNEMKKEKATIKLKLGMPEPKGNLTFSTR